MCFKMADGSDGHVELILDAGKHVACLQTKLKIISGEQEKEWAKATDDVDKAGMNHENVGVDSLKVNLSKLHLPFVDGNILEWILGYFKSTIHEQNIPTVSKFSYLKSVLKGSALSSIAGIPLISENYDLVIQLLRIGLGEKKSLLTLCIVSYKGDG